MITSRQKKTVPSTPVCLRKELEPLLSFFGSQLGKIASSNSDAGDQAWSYGYVGNLRDFQWKIEKWIEKWLMAMENEGLSGMGVEQDL